jgi:predicted TIM-barrel fold metal-dependent hydrolase
MFLLLNLKILIKKGKVKRKSKTISISNNPLSRVPVPMIRILEQGNVFFDVHCHVFNYRDVPDKFLGIRIPQNERILSYLEKILHRIKNSSDTDKHSNLGYFINFLRTRTSAEITEKLFKYYSEKDLIICPLMVDMATGIGGKIIDDFQIQIEKMKALRNTYPDRILPFLALDPNNPKMKENFQKVFAEDGDYNFFGVKIYPSLGYLPSHPELMDIFNICEEKKIPVTAHCSGAIVHSGNKIIRDIPGFHQNSDGSWSDTPITMSFRKKTDYANFFNQPANWKPVLEQFPKLKINLAHFGGDDAWKKFSSGEPENWVNRIIDMMYRFENLYADFSYTFYKQKYSRALKKLLTENELISSRILYGSDYYMVVTEGHFRSLIISFTTTMGDDLMNKIAKENPSRFLFG